MFQRQFTGQLFSLYSSMQVPVIITRLPSLLIEQELFYSIWDSPLADCTACH